MNFMKRKGKKSEKYNHFKQCPVCGAKTFDYDSWSEEYLGIVEQHGLCHRCGYVVQQAYSPVYEAFWDVKRGFSIRMGTMFLKMSKDIRGSEEN